MKTAKLSIGIISIVLSVFVIFQSCAAGISNSLSSNGESSGTGGLFVAASLMVAGIVGLATRKSVGNGGPLTAAGFYLFAALTGVMMAGSYSDLYVWAFMAWAFGLVYLVDGLYDYSNGAEKWYQKTWVIILALIFFPPVGIALIWLSKRFGLVGRILTTIFCALAFLVMAGQPWEASSQSPVTTSSSVQSQVQSAESTQNSTNSSNNGVTQLKEKVYGLNETWTVDGQFSLTFTSAMLTDDRNQFDDSNPAQVVILTYNYENIGVEKNIMDLYISSSNFSVIDGSGVVATSYPASTEYPQETPIGAKCLGAQEAYGLKTASSEVTVKVSVYGEGYESHEATFKLPVQ